MGTCHASCNAADAWRSDLEEPSVKVADGSVPVFQNLSAADGPPDYENTFLTDGPPELSERVPILDEEFVKTEGSASHPAQATQARETTTASAGEPWSKDEQLRQVVHSEGVFVTVDYKESIQDLIRQEDLLPGNLYSNSEEAYTDILESHFMNSTRVIGVLLNTRCLGRQFGESMLVEYLLTVKRLVPFVTLDEKLGDGQFPDAKLLDAIADAGFFGMETRATIEENSQEAVKRLVEQQFEFAQLAASRSLVPVLRIEVSPDCSGREQREKFLCQTLLRSLRKLDRKHPGVILSLSCPSSANTYLPLLGHPAVLRVLARDLAASNRSESCKALSQNVGLIANVNCQDLLATDGGEVQVEAVDTPATSNATMLEQRFVASFEKFKEASRVCSVKEQQMVRVSMQDGFFIGIDQDSSKSSACDTLKTYGIELPQECSTRQAYHGIRQLRSRVFRDPAFAGDRIIGAIVGEDSLEQSIEGMPTAQYLWERKRVVPYLRLFKSLASEKNGVQLMKNVTKLDALLDKAAQCGIFGTKTRSFIRLPKAAGIQAAVEQQFSMARSILAKGLVPVLQMEIDIRSPDKVKCERLLYDALMEGLENLRHHERVILDLTVPTAPNTYLPLIGHPNTIRVTALSGGLPCREACTALAQNVGLVASFGRAFIEELRLTMSDEEFSQKLDESCEALMHASNAVPTKEMQLIKVSSTDGIFAPLDKTGNDMEKMLQRYGVNTEGSSETDMWLAAHERLSRIITNPKMNGSVFIGVSLAQETMNHRINGEPVATYLWEQKNIVPFLKLGRGLCPEKNGARLLKEMPGLDQLLSEAKDAGIFGTKMRSVIRLAKVSAIKAIVKQLFELSKHVFAKGLVPILMPEIDIKSPNKAECEAILCDELLESLGNLRTDERVLLWLTLPSTPNRYLSLIHHPNCIRVMALSGGYGAQEACELLVQNVGMVGAFERCLFADITRDQLDSDFTKALDASCKAVFDASRTLSVKAEQMHKLRFQDGFLAALDQHRNQIPEVLDKYGVQKSQYQTGKEMEDRAFEMYSRIIANPKFNGARIIGVVIFEDFLDRDIDYMPCATYMWQRKRMVPFLKVDRGLQPEKDGVQLMKDVHRLDQMLDKAAEVGIFGTKARSVIKKPNPQGIRAVVEQQFEIAKHILARGMVPIMHLEVDLAAEDKPGCERVLRQVLMGVLRELERTEQKVCFQVTLPSTPKAYASLIGHPNVIRVLAPSGGHNNREACELLNQNPGMIASFGRALIADLHVSQTDRQFTQVLDRACREVYDASRGASKSASSSTSNQKKDSNPPTPRTPRAPSDVALGA